MIDQSDLKWRVLGTLNVFRLILALVLILLFFAGDEPRLIVTTWNPDGSPCRRLDFKRHDIELALIELEHQGDLPAVLLHPLVIDFV